MSSNAAHSLDASKSRSAVEIAEELGPVFARRAEQQTDEDRFVAEDFAD
ncbi:hypothetical protein [Bradyrhizobium sp. Leo170]|nr:hypothetical protein [Bradyrhizobium sp. Leo170]